MGKTLYLHLLRRYNLFDSFSELISGWWGFEFYIGFF